MRIDKGIKVLKNNQGITKRTLGRVAVGLGAALLGLDVKAQSQETADIELFLANEPGTKEERARLGLQLMDLMESRNTCSGVGGGKRCYDKFEFDNWSITINVLRNPDRPPTEVRFHIEAERVYGPDDDVTVYMFDVLDNNTGGPSGSPQRAMSYGRELGLKDQPKIDYEVDDPELTKQENLVNQIYKGMMQLILSRS